MRRPTLLPTAFCLAFLLWCSLAGPTLAENFTVQVLNFSFQPANLTISPGDTVTWSNVSGTHNVRATAGDSFRCANGCDGAGGNGDPSSANWSFSRTFNAEGTIDYDCELHAGLGMTGRVTVRGNDPPGSLQFSVANRAVNEAVGTVSIEVTRVGGDDGAVSVDFATADGSAMAGSDYQATSGTLNWPDNDDDPKNFFVQIIDDTDDESNETVNLMLSNPGGGALLGLSSATLTINDNDQAQVNNGVIELTEATLSVQEGGAAQVVASRTGGSDGAVSVAFQTSDGSAVAGQDYSATSGTLSWANGDLEAKSFSVQTLQDSLEEPTETVNVTLSAPTGGADLGARSSAMIQIADDDAVLEACVPDATTLCLNQDGRFRARVTYRTAQNATGAGRTFDIGQPDSGLFYFFQETNIEMLVKVLNGCGITNHFWVFFAATTDVEFTLTVTDTQTGAQKTYFNALGQAANAVTDVQAFATCP